MKKNDTGHEKKEENNKNPNNKEETKNLSENTEKNKELVQELIINIQRIQAEFENYKKRTQKEKEEISDYSKAELIKKILPALDNLELALINTKNSEEFSKGIKLVYSQFIEALENEGLEKIKAKKFDPSLHEALLTEESKEEEGTILEELQKGYVFKNKIIRHTKVKVAK